MTKHAVDRYLDFIRYLGEKDLHPPVFSIAIEQENVKKVKELLRENGLQEGDRFIAVSPTALLGNQDVGGPEVCGALRQAVG